MMRAIGFVCTILVSVMLAYSASARESKWVDGQNTNSPFMRIYGQALPPIGHVSFCRMNEGECLSQDSRSGRIELTSRRRRDLRDINALVNQMVLPISDQALYGRLEHWTYPAGKGDCEDFVLLKRRMLLERGWPASALLITVVLDEKGEGHAILTARTADGDFILDNRDSKILLWHRSAYSFVKRQSLHDPQIWMSLTPPGLDQPQQVSGIRSR